MLHWFRMLRFPVLNGMYLPFKIYHTSRINIRKGANFQLKGRLTLGNPDSESTVVSQLPINLFFGKQSIIELGRSISVGPGVNIIVKDKAKLQIGDNTYFTSDLHVEAIHRIEIGNDCAISWGVTLIDGDHHRIVPEKSGTKERNYLKIGNHVWIGCNVTVLKGSEIGDNCIVAAGSVVTGIFPNNVLIAGVPAKIIKQGINWE